MVRREVRDVEHAGDEDIDLARALLPEAVEEDLVRRSGPSGAAEVEPGVGVEDDELLELLSVVLGRHDNDVDIVWFPCTPIQRTPHTSK